MYQGQRYSWQSAARGKPALDIEPAAFVTFLENHDQVANSGRGRRIHALASPGKYRALTALTLLGPGTPMLFQGQEFASSAPFLYFADHDAEMARSVREGRKEFLRQFPARVLGQRETFLFRRRDQFAVAKQNCGPVMVAVLDTGAYSNHIHASLRPPPGTSRNER